MKKSLKPSSPGLAPSPFAEPVLKVMGAREHNLKNISLTLPHHQLIVVTGVSGSGKSSLIFDTLYAEGHRRYMETLETTYVRQFIELIEQPDVDKVEGLPCVIGVKQETSSNRTLRATVGTTTEIYAFLRLLYARASQAFSYLTGERMVARTQEEIRTQISAQFKGQQVQLLAPVVKGRKGHYQALFKQLYKKGFRQARIDGHWQEITTKLALDRYKVHDIELVVAPELKVTNPAEQSLEQAISQALEHGRGSFLLHTPARDYAFSSSLVDVQSGLSYEEPSPNNFSHNSPYGACPQCEGFGQVKKAKEELLLPNKSLSLRQGALPWLGPYKATATFQQIAAWLGYHDLSIDTPFDKITASVRRKVLYGDVGPESPLGLTYSTETSLVGYLLRGRIKTRQALSTYFEIMTCPACQGKRLNREALHFKLGGKDIAQLATMELKSLAEWLKKLPEQLNERQRKIAHEVLKEINKRLDLLLDIGLHYLHLFRPMQTLSGGETQRLRLATQIGTQLSGVLYLLDEPSIGLHQRDNAYLIQALKALRDMGNTVVVIEHDKETMEAADFLVEIGPRAGRHGGQVVASAPPEAFLQQASATADYLQGKLSLELPTQRSKGSGKQIVIEGCTGRNLKGLELRLPLGQFVVMTGVSGSGKSTLTHRTLVPILKKQLGLNTFTPLPYTKAKGLTYIDKVIEVDQSPIGRTPRSNPATYTGLFTHIRQLFAQLPEAKIRGYKVGRFSFNVKGGRCETCLGGGVKLIEMDFLPSVRVPCETCRRKRYNRETLEIRYKGKSISDVLEMTVETALEFFGAHKHIATKLKALHEVGLGYITLGQHATTFSGGEAQRIKLATELARKATGSTLFILDEPSTGLHFQDIVHLLKVVRYLADKGNTVLVIEHNMDIIKMADHVIDLGPEASQEGGQIIAQGTPEEVAKATGSATASFLAKELAQSQRQKG